MSTSTKSFWSGIPGLMTAIAGILTGVVGLGTLAYQLGVVGDKDKSSNETVQSTPEDGGSGTSGAAGGAGATGATAGKVSFTVDRSDVTLSAVKPEAVVTVTNQGSTPLTVKKPDLSGPDEDKFSADGAACTSRAVAPGRSCAVTVTYTGGVDAKAKMTVSADGASDEDVALKGTIL